MKELTRNELAAIKRVAATTKSLKTKKAKLYAKIAELDKLITDLNKEILTWEAPIIAMTGYTSDEVLDGSWKKDIEENEVLPDDDMVAEVPDFVVNDIINN